MILFKLRMCAILMVLFDFPKALNVITGSEYAERDLLLIEIAELILDDSELTSLFIQL